MYIGALKTQVQKAAIERLEPLAGLPYRRQIPKFQDLDDEEASLFQAERLPRVYQDTVKPGPYYRDRPRFYTSEIAKGSRPFDIEQKLPTLKKSAMKEQTERFWQEPALGGAELHTTGGSTGTPLRIRASLMDHDFPQVMLDDKSFRIFGTATPRAVRNRGYFTSSNCASEFFRAISGTTYKCLSICSLSTTNRYRLFDVLQSFQPPVTQGYASTIYRVALHFEDSPMARDQEPFIVTTTFPTVFPDRPDQIERNLLSPVFDDCGSQERQHLVIECQYGHKHIYPPGDVVEPRQVQSDAPAGEVKTVMVMVAGLADWKMNLKCYSTRDTAVFVDFSVGCNLGSGWPAMGAVFARIEKLDMARDGRQIPLSLNFMLKDVEEIREVQIIQTNFDSFIYDIATNEAHAVKPDQNMVGVLRGRVVESATIRFECDLLPNLIDSWKCGEVMVEFTGSVGQS